MQKNFLLALLLIVFTNAVMAQNYTRLWINKFSDTTASYQTKDMAVDAGGNAYITGYFNLNDEEYYEDHLFLMKINRNGKQEWMRHFTDALDSIDVGTAVTVDSLGYIYVTGSRSDTFCNVCTVSSKITDVITMKYDANGNRIWLNRYHDSIYVLAQPTDLQVLPNGTLCVIGNEDRYNFKTFQYSSNMLLLKINADGKTQWVRKKDKAVGNAVCFDKDKNIIVAGASDPSGEYMLQKPAIYKYSASGLFQYTTIFDEVNKNGRFYFIACDNANNIYANGQTDTIAFNNDPHILTSKYTPAGTQLWYRKEQSFSHTTPHFYGGFAIDAAGNGYLTGYLKITDINRDIITTKYNSAGKRQWINQFDGPLHAYDVPTDLALDKKGNVYITGSTSRKGGYEYVTLGYAGNGTQIGVDYYSGNGGTNSFAQAIAVDNGGNVFTSGITPEAVTTIKYGKKPSLMAPIEVKATNSIRMYPNPAKDNITVLYTTSSSNVQGADCFITDMYGNVLMQKRLPIVDGTGSINFTLQSLHTGIYVIKVKENSMLVSKSFLKQ